MVALFVLLFSGLQRMVNFVFFLKVEQVYFFFLYLLLLNEQLVLRVLKLLKLYFLKVSLVFSLEATNFFLKILSSFLNFSVFYNSIVASKLLFMVNFSNILLKCLGKSLAFGFCIKRNNNILLQKLNMSSVLNNCFLVRNSSVLFEATLFKHLMDSVFCTLLGSQLSGDFLELFEENSLLILDLYILLFNAVLMNNFRKFLVFFKR